jgi:hypothetical protein
MLKINLYNKKKSEQNVISYIIDSKNDIHGVVSYFEDVQNNNDGDSIELEESHHFQLAPRPLKEKERSVLFVAGESGAGKSYYIRDYAKYYNKMFPKNPIYLISYLKYDETLDSYDKIKRINAFTAEFLDDCMSIELSEFKDSLIIFDDIDSIHNIHVKRKIYGFLAKLLRLGRHENISVAYLGHELYASFELKSILNESHSITWFPKFLNHKKSTYLLEQYFGLSKSQIQRIQSIKNSRSLTYIKGSDKIVITEREMFIL